MQQFLSAGIDIGPLYLPAKTGRRQRNAVSRGAFFCLVPATNLPLLERRVLIAAGPATSRRSLTFRAGLRYGCYQPDEEIPLTAVNPFEFGVKLPHTMCGPPSASGPKRAHKYSCQAYVYTRASAVSGLALP